MIRPFVTLLSAALLLTACGNDPNRRSAAGAVSTSKQILSGLTKKQAAPAAAPSADQIVALISQTLSSTEKNAALVVVENRNAVATVINIAQNGDVNTWATSDARTLSTRNGRVVATRGLGFDLMSVTDTQTRALISARRAGQAQLTMRFLNGENETIAQKFVCSYARGVTAQVSIGEINAKTVQMRERCSNSVHSFENSYLVDGRGRVVQARQWIGPENGYMLWQALRL